MNETTNIIISATTSNTTTITTTPTTATATASSNRGTDVSFDLLEICNNSRSDSETSDLFKPSRVIKRKTLEDYDKVRSYNAQAIAVDVHRRNDSTESDDNCIDDPKKGSKIQKP